MRIKKDAFLTGDASSFIGLVLFKHLLVFCLLFLLFPLQSAGASATDLIDKAKQLNIAQDPTWLRLLHYEQGRSVVLSDTFFLSSTGKIDPEAELLATIKSFFLPWGQNSNMHPRCMFPARYFWLNKQLEFPGYTPKEDRCESFEKWSLVESVQSVSILLVSGYFGNPASTFGHTLLKLNTPNSKDDSDLFDVTLGYGAMVPEHENGVLYVARGLFGGYKAGFSDRYFYTQDTMYAHTEFRDMWDYQLILTKEQRQFLIRHIWEMAGNKFAYYFLKKNCAYRLAQLIELVTGKDLTRNKRFWYLPVELFYRLQEQGLVQSVKYRPSDQRILHGQLQQLSAQELKIFNAIVKEGLDSISLHMAELTQARQIVLLECLIAYQHYRLVADHSIKAQDREKFKDRILTARLNMPAQERPKVKIKELPSPADGTRPMAFSTGVVTGRDNKSFLRLDWAAFKQEMVGQNSLEGDEFVVLDVALAGRNGSGIFLDQVDLVRILKLNTVPVSISDESQWSWQLRAGIDRVQGYDEGDYDGVAGFGIGRARKLKEWMIVYGMVEEAGHTLSPYVRIRPHVGARFDLGKMRAWIFGGVESADYKGRLHDVWGGKFQYQLSKKDAVTFEINNEKATRATLAYVWYW